MNKEPVFDTRPVFLAPSTAPCCEMPTRAQYWIPQDREEKKGFPFSGIQLSPLLACRES